MSQLKWGIGFIKITACANNACYSSFPNYVQYVFLTVILEPSGIVQLKLGFGTCLDAACVTKTQAFLAAVCLPEQTVVFYLLVKGPLFS